MKITVIIILSFLISFSGALAQESSPFSVSGYAEMYYIFDFNKPVNNTRPEFIYSHNRHNEVNINLGLI
ncbi:MAG TPA: outer membrane beta-barrel protein, partial [Cyclobacteriaceae bacterium]|nr:outer membrane beta-barrel protein [Cyclobacteriaceae bacterium]